MIGTLTDLTSGGEPGLAPDSPRLALGVFAPIEEHGRAGESIMLRRATPKPGAKALIELLHEISIHKTFAISIS